MTGGLGGGGSGSGLVRLTTLTSALLKNLGHCSSPTRWVFGILLYGFLLPFLSFSESGLNQRQWYRSRQPLKSQSRLSWRRVFIFLAVMPSTKTMLGMSGCCSLAAHLSLSSLIISTSWTAKAMRCAGIKTYRVDLRNGSGSGLRPTMAVNTELWLYDLLNEKCIFIGFGIFIHPEIRQPVERLRTEGCHL